MGSMYRKIPFLFKKKKKNPKPKNQSKPLGFQEPKVDYVPGY